MKRPFMVLAFIAAALAPVPATYAQNSGGWEPPAHWTQAQRDRYRDLLEELRCLVCQNESLASSSASLAGDLRTQVRDMVDRGVGNEEIKAYLVERYGDFVLYDPPVKPSTWLLWLGPFLVLILAGIIAWKVVRTARSEVSDLSGEEHARARRYLDERRE